WLVWAAFLVGLIPGLHEKYWRFVKKHYYEQGASCGLVRGYAREFESKNGRKPNDAELLDWCTNRFTADVAGMEYVPDAVEMQFRSPSRGGR
ncbi:hypothetical protein QT600_22505, partial [Xanthomonas citri pv. citri]